MSDIIDTQEKLDIKQFESSENTSYSPIIKELTPKQIKQINIDFGKDERKCHFHLR